ncbi:Uncharacterised protein [Chlamydia trachomatis]|nr:Uncharacterised protein [Chlamydia trachomatis]
MQGVGCIESHTSRNSLGIFGRSNIAPEHVVAIAVDLCHVGNFTTIHSTFKQHWRVVDEFAIGNLQFFITSHVTTIGILQLAQCNAINTRLCSIDIFGYKHVVVTILLIEIGCFDNHIFKQHFEVLSFSGTTFGIDVGIGEAQQAHTIKLLGHPINSLAVASETTSD